MPTFVDYDGEQPGCEGQVPGCSEPPQQPRRSRPLFELYPDPTGAQEQWTAAHQSVEQWAETIRGLLSVVTGLRLQRDGLKLQRDGQDAIRKAFAHEAAIDFEKEIEALELRIALVNDYLEAAQLHRLAAQKIEREAQVELGERADEALGKKGDGG